MRKTALLIALLSSASMMLRRSRRLGPIKVLVLGALLEEILRRLRAQSEPIRSPEKHSLWAKLTRPKSSTPQTE